MSSSPSGRNKSPPASATTHVEVIATPQTTPPASPISISRKSHGSPASTHYPSSGKGKGGPKGTTKIPKNTPVVVKKEPTSGEAQKRGDVAAVEGPIKVPIKVPIKQEKTSDSDSSPESNFYESESDHKPKTVKYTKPRVKLEANVSEKTPMHSDAIPISRDIVSEGVINGLKEVSATRAKSASKGSLRHARHARHARLARGNPNT